MPAPLQTSSVVGAGTGLMRYQTSDSVKISDLCYVMIIVVKVGS